ncbi:hypothetical protein SAMN04488020_12021 [Palleronia marisminoris]|uniref:Uncharacterized protein n=1 Tax=Palleronia marisminoris TaxID=315423 RepID=A0A1Y5TTF6_9RHOB|nr:hypothetical protein [Palleronia marisminoris]SFH52803.1 hypothetical protein SAMN04488020_12021 [Palleronia marisminoris]SLN71649.1 hypothetical protein PAM7066_03681 [Palleronia marisminoris]
MTRIWPPHCCVPAFVHAALVQHGVEFPFPETIPGLIGVRVDPSQDNPLKLALADAAHPPGIRGADAELEVNRMFADLELDLRLRRVRFDSLKAELWVDVLDAALSSGAAVGIGFDYNHFMGRTTPKAAAQHVLRVLYRDVGSLTLFDDSGEAKPATINADFQRVKSAVLSIRDGFWIINDRTRLDFPHVPMWQS